MSDERNRSLSELLRREDPLRDLGELGGDEVRRMRRAVLAEAAAAPARRWWQLPVPATALATLAALAVLALAVGAYWRQKASVPAGAPFERPATIAAAAGAAEPTAHAASRDAPPVEPDTEPAAAVAVEAAHGDLPPPAVESPGETPVRVAEAGLDDPGAGDPLGTVVRQPVGAQAASLQPVAVEPRQPRNIRFATDGGTRVIWVLNPDLDLDPDLPHEQTTGESS